MAREIEIIEECLVELGPEGISPPEGLADAILASAKAESCPMKPERLGDYVFAVGCGSRPAITEPFGPPWCGPWPKVTAKAREIIEERLVELGPQDNDPEGATPPEGLADSIFGKAKDESFLLNPERLRDYVFAVSCGVRPAMTEPFGGPWSDPWPNALDILIFRVWRLMKKVFWGWLGQVVFVPGFSFQDEFKPTMKDAEDAVFDFLHGTCDCHRRRPLTPANQKKADESHPVRHSAKAWDPAEQSFAAHGNRAFAGATKAGNAKNLGISPGAFVGSMIYHHWWRRPGLRHGNVAAWVCPHHPNLYSEGDSCYYCKKEVEQGKRNKADVIGFDPAKHARLIKENRIVFPTVHGGLHEERKFVPCRHPKCPNGIYPFLPDLFLVEFLESLSPGRREEIRQSLDPRDPPEKTLEKLKKLLEASEWALASRGKCPLCGHQLEKLTGNDTVTAFVRVDPPGGPGFGARHGDPRDGGGDDADQLEAEDHGVDLPEAAEGGDRPGDAAHADAPDDDGERHDECDCVDESESAFDAMAGGDLAGLLDLGRLKKLNDLLKSRSQIVRTCVKLSEQGEDLDAIARKVGKNVALVAAWIKQFYRDLGEN